MTDIPFLKPSLTPAEAVTFYSLVITGLAGSIGTIVLAQMIKNKKEIPLGSLTTWTILFGVVAVASVISIARSSKDWYINKLSVIMNEIITLDHIKNRSIDDILKLYRYGYRLEEHSHSTYNPVNPSPINPSTLQTCPEGCVLQSEIDTSYNSGLYFGITAGIILGIMIGTIISYIVVKRDATVPTTS